MSQSTIALDAMGGDSKALPNVHGSFLALQREKDLKLILCGPKDKLHEAAEELSEQEPHRPEFRFSLREFNAYLEQGRLSIEHCSQVVGMEESPSVAIRSKKESSMAKAFELVRSKEADALVSAGNSGAIMAFGVGILKRLPDIKRPAILCHYPSQNGVVCMLDAGANVDCTAQHLEQFAHLGSIYTKTVFETNKPRVALLNIGEEESKGNELVKETHQLLKKSLAKEYVGFVEGRDILTGVVDVIVCDGFVGNVALKTIEGVAKVISGILKEEFSKNAIWGLGAWLAKGGFTAMKTKLDYREYGAAPLVGLQGLGLVAHGSSDARAIMNSIRMGSLYAQQGLMEKLTQSFSNRS